MKLDPLDLAQLHDAQRAGLRRIARADLGALDRACRAQGIVVFPVDLHGIRDKEGLLQAFAAALTFPDWFGHNWDALADALGDLGWLPEPEGYVLLLDGLDDFEAADPQGVHVLLEILDAVASSWAMVGAPFWALRIEPAAAGKP